MSGIAAGGARRGWGGNELSLNWARSVGPVSSESYLRAGLRVERIDDAVTRLEVLARRLIAPDAPPFTTDGRRAFDALLQSRLGVFAADLLVGDTILWSSTAGGVQSLRQLWVNVAGRRG